MKKGPGHKALSENVSILYERILSSSVDSFQKESTTILNELPPL